MSYAESTFPKVPWRPVGFNIEVLCRHSKTCVCRAYMRTILPGSQKPPVSIAFTDIELA
jgi:hypothetical protein